MHIQKIEIHNIRSIEQLIIELPTSKGWHVFLGDNGAGKSTILKGISLALIGLPTIHLLRENWESWLRRGTKRGFIKLSIDTDGINDFDIDGKTPIGYSVESTLSFELKNSKKGMVEVSQNVSPDDECLESELVGWFSAAYGPFRRLQEGDKEYRDLESSGSDRLMAHISAFNIGVTLNESIEWLKELDYRKLKKSKATVSLNAVKQFINKSGFLPGNSKIVDITPDGVFIKDSGKVKVSIYEISDGYRSMLSMILELIRQIVINLETKFKFKKNKEEGYLYIPCTGIVMIDEVDVHLHPNWQVRIGDWFKKFFPNIQFIVTTHSPLICRSAEGGSIWKIELPDSELPSGQVSEEEFNRLVYGNVLEAMGTELFGTSNTRSKSSNAKLDELAKLNMLKSLGKISKKDKEKLSKLRKTFTTDDSFEF